MCLLLPEIKRIGQNTELEWPGALQTQQSLSPLLSHAPTPNLFLREPQTPEICPQKLQPLLWCQPPGHPPPPSLAPCRPLVIHRRDRGSPCPCPGPTDIP